MAHYTTMTLILSGISSEISTIIFTKPSIANIQRSLSTLTELQKLVMFHKHTEKPFSSRYNDLYEMGVYSCALCNNALFSSSNKYDSGTGWPSFDMPISNRSVKYVIENVHTNRTAIKCYFCGAHLGHVFDDGPENTTGRRYCLNGVSMNFEGITKFGDNLSSPVFTRSNNL
ncbi:hypothetical protein GJ496_005787 [Pomphorhynchus laevis]|nr:hypothetical protein GJ496_005787 [Pomphorhynchus laevis]